MKKISYKNILNKIENTGFSEREQEFSMVRNALRNTFDIYIRFFRHKIYISLRSDLNSKDTMKAYFC